MGRVPVPVLGAWLVAILMALSPRIGWAAPPPACGAGRYLLSADLTTGEPDHVGKALVIGADGVSVPGICASIAPKVLKGTKKGTKVRAEWPVAQCDGFSGKKVVLTGKIVDGCTQFVGRLKAKKAKQKVQGGLSTCGDGKVDAAGGLEACDPPGTATCNAACQLPPGPLAATLGIANYAVSVPTDGSQLLGPVIVTLLDADGTELGTITKTFEDGFLSEFVSPTDERASLLINVQHRLASPSLLIRLTLTVGDRWLQIDLAGEDTVAPGWLSTATLTTPADYIVVPPALGVLLPGDAGTVATLPILVDGQMVVDEADLARWFEATGLEDLGLQSFAAAALMATLNDEALALNIASHFVDGGPATLLSAGGALGQPRFHKTPFCASLLTVITGGAGGIACGVCIPSLISTPVTGGLSAMLAVPGCTLCASLIGGSVSELLLCKTSEYNRTTARDCTNFECNPSNGEVPQVDEQTEHSCWCTCNDDRCNTACALMPQQLGATFPNGAPRPPLPPSGGACTNNDCVCTYPPDDFCKSSFQNYCGGGQRVGGRKFEYDCPRAACGDGRWSQTCSANPGLSEQCDPTADAAGKRGTCSGTQGCDTSCHCVTCSCGPNTATPTCPTGDTGAYCGPEDCQCHSGCLTTADCPAGKECGNGVCVGAGALSFRLEWNVDTDLDIHVTTPLGNEIYYGRRSADGGTLDVDACVSSCSKGTENVFFTQAPVGHYEVWARNYSGRKAARFSLKISQAGVSLTKYGSVPAAASDSTHFSFEVAPR